MSLGADSEPSEATSWRCRDQPDARAPAVNGGDGYVKLAEALYGGKSDKANSDRLSHASDKLKLISCEKVQRASPTVS